MNTENIRPGEILYNDADSYTEAYGCGGKVATAGLWMPHHFAPGEDLESLL